MNIYYSLKYILQSHFKQIISYIGVRPMVLRGAAAPLEFSNSHFRQFGQKSGNIRAKPLDYRASNGTKYSGNRLQPP